MRKINAKVIVIFPYGGFKAGSSSERLFWRIVEVAQRVTTIPPAVIVLNSDTVRKGQAKAFLRDPRHAKLDVVVAWSVDTCQMWLHGWGHVLDTCRRKRLDRVIQFPGDIERLEDEQAFLGQLEVFATLGGWSLAVGEFQIGGRFGAKSLIDQYGTYPLMSIWFPELTRSVLSLPLNRPRSEFLNLDAKTLDMLLLERKFAYEQTINMLISCWDSKSATWKRGVRVTPHQLGTLQDNDSQRHYIGCLDQIERTERMLKLRWREVNSPGPNAKDAEYSRFIETFHRLDRLSTASRESAAITIRSLLGIGTIA